MPRGSGRSAKRAAALDALKSGDDDVLRPPVGEHVEDGFVVRHVSGASGKAYRCPGCDQELRPSTPHVVSWPEGRPDDRRHWHAACWSARDRRGVKVQRSKNAPRYG
ncbi:MAG: ATP/GTP-binding protein [Frankiales bacterium]|nr:ATP/GTP-binding protein [Frankiales bacterium]